MNKSKKIIIVVIIVVLSFTAFLLYFGKSQSPQAIVYNASKKSFAFVKTAPFNKKPFKLKSGELNLAASQSKKELFNLLVRKDTKGHFLIKLATPKTSFSIYLVGDNIIVKQPKALIGPAGMPAIWYYKFEKGTLEKLKNDVAKLKAASEKNKNATKKIDAQFLKDFENFSKKNTEWTKAKTDGAMIITVKMPLLKLVDFFSEELDKLQNETPLQNSNKEQTAIVKDIISTIIDDALSETNISNEQKDALKKEIFTSIDNSNNINSMSKSQLDDVKKNIEKIKEQLTPSDNLTITLKINEGKISEIVILPQIKKAQNAIQKISIEFKYDDGLLKLITFNFPTPKEQNSKNRTIEANILYDNNMWNGIEISNYGDNNKVNPFKMTLTWNINKEVAEVKLPSLIGAMDIKSLLGSFIQMNGQ